jgi:hypothetical protein
MKDIQILIWSFPILFIFHDFEEIIFIQAWICKNKYFLTERFPSFSKRLMPYFENITTSSFALGAAEEFVLISIVTYVSYITNWYNLWIGLFIAFAIHLLMHCFQALIIRKYIPALGTSLICLPVCIYIIKQIVELYSLNVIILYSLLGLMILIINLAGIHKVMYRFTNWLARYEKHS